VPAWADETEGGEESATGSSQGVMLNLGDCVFLQALSGTKYPKMEFLSKL
jgi:hypothetical protein